MHQLVLLPLTWDEIVYCQEMQEEGNTAFVETFSDGLNAFREFQQDHEEPVHQPTKGSESLPPFVRDWRERLLTQGSIRAEVTTMITRCDAEKNPLGKRELLLAEVQHVPEPLLDELLDFVLFLKKDLSKNERVLL